MTGVNRMGVSGTSPTVAITVTGLTTNQSDDKLILNNARISWSCIVPTTAYDPNATTGPYATGQACSQ